MYQKSCGRIVRRARCLPRRLKMYPTIEALRQTSKAGVFLICFLAHEERARRARLVTEFDEGYSIREGKADRNSLLKLIIQIGKMAI